MGRNIGIGLLVVMLSACDGSGDSGPGGAAGSGGSGGETGGTAGMGAGGSSAGGSSTGGSSMGGSSTGGSSTGGTSTGGGGAGGSEFSPEAVALCNVINDYRASLGLEEVAVSPALMTVAQHHVEDLAAHPEIVSGQCNLHSWSDGSDLWSGCCYTPDHAKAQCMWDKPREITASWGADKYQGNGYEIAEAGAGSPEGALELWKSSPPHHDVIKNADIWKGFSPWPAFGCGMKGGYGVVWFGDAQDPQSP